MKFVLKYKASLVYILLIMMFSSITQSHAVDSPITNARSIVAFGADEAFLINTLDELYFWDQSVLKWHLFTVTTPPIRQMDAISTGTITGTDVIATDVNNIVQEWNGAFGFDSVWTTPQGATQYNWALHDPFTQEIMGQRTGLPNVWEKFFVPTPDIGDPWNKFLPADPDGTPKGTPLFFIDKNPDTFHRWERGDVRYAVALDNSQSGVPFHIYYFGDDPDAALARITDPPLLTHNIDDVFAKQISYDELEQNLWCVDINGIAYRWDNTNQEWIQSNIRDDTGFQPEPPDPEPGECISIEENFILRLLSKEGEPVEVTIAIKVTTVICNKNGKLKSTKEFEAVITHEHDSPHEPITGRNHRLRPGHKFVHKLSRFKGRKGIIQNGFLTVLLKDYDIISDEQEFDAFLEEHGLRIRR